MGRNTLLVEATTTASVLDADNVLDELLDSSSEAERLAERRFEPIHGALVGGVLGRDDRGRLVVQTHDPAMTVVVSKSTIAQSELKRKDRVVLLFEQGDPARPILVGALQPCAADSPATQHEGDQPLPELPIAATVDDERIVIQAQREIVLQCGKASITLTRAGKVLLRGAYVSSRSSGVNRIKGGSVQIN